MNPNKIPPKAVVLSSGGLDSTTVMAIAQSRGFELFSLSFDYGQRHVLNSRPLKRWLNSSGSKSIWFAAWT